jgi:hypothetical protein
LGSEVIRWLRETSPRTSLLSTDAAGFRHERISADPEAIDEQQAAHGSLVRINLRQCGHPALSCSVDLTEMMRRGERGQTAMAAFALRSWQR